MGLPDFGGWVEGISKDIVEFGKHPANKVLDLVTGYDLNERSRVRDEQAAGNAERDEIYLQQAGLYGRFSGRFDDPALGSPEAFEAMSHEDIKAAVDGMNGGSLRASAEGWTKIGQSLEQALNDFRDFITRETDGKWEGLAKDSAVAATGRYATESGKLAEAGNLIGTKITEAATGVDQVKATVPPVSKRSLLEVVFDTAMPTSGALKRLIHGQDESHQEAIQIMRTVYTPVMQQADTRVPRLPEPPRVINSAPDATPSSGGTPGTGAPGLPMPYTGGPNSGSPAIPTPSTPLPGGTPGASPAPDTFNPITPGSQPATDNQFAAPTDATTTPASTWTAPAAATGLDGSGLGQSGFGLPGTGAGSYSSGIGSNAGSSSGSGTGGSAGLGGYGAGGIFSGGYGSGGMGSGGGAGSTPSATTGGATPGSTAAGSTGRGGAATGGMMPGAGARGRGGDDDNEHKTPGYLVNVDNGSELIGNLPLAAPPVIGT